MRPRRPLKRELIGLSAALLGLLAVSAAVSYGVRGRAQAKFERSLEGDLDLLTQLMQFRGKLRQVELSSDNYLLTGDDHWMQRREEAMREAGEAERQISAHFVSREDADAWDSFGMELTAYFSGQEFWIRRKAAGDLPHSKAAHVVVLNDSIDDITQRLVDIREKSLDKFQTHRAELQRASLWSLALFLFGLFVTSCAAALYTLRRIIRPVQDELELSKLKTQLVSMVSHEFNNALNAIQAAAYVLEKTERDGSFGNRERLYQMLNASVASLAAVVTNLLNMGRLEAGKFAVRIQPVDVRTLMKESLHALEFAAQRKSLELTLDFPPEAVPVAADPDALALVVSNLLSNAIKYTPEKGRVRLGLEPLEGRPDQVSIYVENTGIGISPEDQAHIFTGYFRTEKGKTAAKGFGIGLPLVKQIIEAHGSVLDLRSEPGKGSRFSFSLPVC